MSLTFDHIRYQRQILLKELGEQGQQKLQEAKVLVVGAGGLGCPALLYLSSAGVGKIGIIDFDVVELSNLQRQILFTTEDLARSKSVSAADRLKKLNPDIELVAIHKKLEPNNAISILQEYDMVIDGSDNFASRYLINDACALLQKPLVYGAVLRFEGQVGVFHLPDIKTGLACNYRDLFPDAGRSSSTISCNETGVLGVVPGIIGSMMAAEAIKIVTGIGKPLLNTILHYNALINSFYEVELIPTSTKYRAPKNAEELRQFDYNSACMPPEINDEISSEEAEVLLHSKGTLLLDVREKDEIPHMTRFEHARIPLAELEYRLGEISSAPTVVVFCNSGSRSRKAVSLLKQKFPAKHIVGLAGGMLNWKNSKQING